MELSTLQFKVDTSELKQAQVELQGLAKAANEFASKKSSSDNEIISSTKKRVTAEKEAADAANTTSEATKKQTNLLERHRDILEFKTQCYSKGQSSQ